MKPKNKSFFWFQQYARWDLFLPLFAIFLSLFLHLHSLDDIFPWADEGETLLLGRMTAEHGVPLAYDGQYRFCPSAKETASHLWIVHPWMQFYVSALGRLFSSQSVFLLRLPFALFGVGCLPLLWLLGRKLKISTPTIGVSMLLMATNVNALLADRNIRYYALAPFFALCCLIFYQDLRSGLRRRWPGFSLSLLFFLNSMHVVAFAFLAALILHAAFFERRRVFWKSFALGCGASLALFSPFLILSFKPLLAYRASMPGTFAHQLAFGDVGVGAALSIIHLLRFNFPTLLFLVLLYYRVKKISFRFLPRQTLFLLSVPVLATCLIMAFVLNQVLFPPYLYACIPLLALLSGVFITAVARGNKWLLGGLTAGVMLSTLLNWPFWPWASEGIGENKISFVFATPVQRKQILRESFLVSHMHTLFFHYLHELKTPYVGPVEGLVQYLRAQAKPDDTFFATNDQETLHYFTGLRRIDSVPFETPPTWLIQRAKSSWTRAICEQGSPESGSVDTYVADFMAQHAYDRIQIEFPDYAQENVPVAPFHHRWSNDGLAGRNWRRVALYRLHENP